MDVQEEPMKLHSLVEWYLGLNQGPDLGELETQLASAEQLPFLLHTGEQDLSVWKNDLDASHFYVIITSRSATASTILGGAVFKKLGVRWQIMNIALDKVLQGKGVGTNLYVAMAQYLKADLVSSPQLSASSEKLWLGLERKKSTEFKTYVLDTKTDKMVIPGGDIPHPKDDPSGRFALCLTATSNRVNEQDLAFYNYVFRKPGFWPMTVPIWSEPGDE